MPATQVVTLQRASERASGFLALPHDANCHSAIIVIHEWWGLNQWVKQQTWNLAASGYVALAVDLYQGNVTADPSEARKLKRRLRADHAICTLRAAFDYLARRPDVHPDHIGSLGWSMGGGLALELAIDESRLTACAVHYGPLPTSLAQIRKINAQALGLFGARDRGVPPQNVRAFERSMKMLNKSVDIKIYDGVGHGFENPANKAGYRADIAADAWSRTLRFFGQREEP